MKNILKIILIFSYINISSSLILLNQTKYSNNFFFYIYNAISESYFYSYLNSIISKENISKTEQEFIEQIIKYVLDLYDKTKPFPVSILFSEELRKCLNEFREITFPIGSDKGFYTFFEGTGKSMNDFGNEHHCIINLNNNSIGYYLFQAHIKDPKQLTNYEDFYFHKLLNQSFFYIGICIPNQCEDFVKMMLKNKAFLDFLYDKVSLSNFTLILDEHKRNEYQNKFKYNIGIFYTFCAILIIKVIFSAIRSFFMRKDYNYLKNNISEKNSFSEDKKKKK